MSTNSSALLKPSGEEDVAELLQRIRQLEVIGRRQAAGLAPGDYQTAVRGRGLLFHETRKYVAGEPARSIDWNITARLGGEPHVRVHLEERQREVIVALDMSPSMHFGSQERTKLELAVELAAILAVSAIDAGDRLGHVLFADRVLENSRPRAGRGQLFRVLRSILRHTGNWQRSVAVSDPRTAIHAIESRRGSFAIFLISDFIDHDLSEDLKYLRARHDVSLLHVFDPLELSSRDTDRSSEITPIVLADSPENGGSPRPLALGSQESRHDTEASLRQRCGHLGMAFGSFSTEKSARHSLHEFFHRSPRHTR